MLVLLAGCATGSQYATATRATAPELGKTIYVARRGWHIDVGFNSEDLEVPLAAVLTDLPAARYVFFGFGDKRYLVARNKHLATLFAALWPGPGMILTTGLGSSPEAAFGDTHVVRLIVSDAQMHELQNYVWNSLFSEDGNLRPHSKGPYDDSFYYGAISTYSGLHTCNTWGAEALQAARLPVRAVGVVFAAQLWRQVERIKTSAVMIDRSASMSANEEISWPRTATRFE